MSPSCIIIKVRPIERRTAVKELLIDKVVLEPYNESVKEQIDELKKEVDRLNGIKSCMKYSTEEIILTD